ncbi:hypothetical protein M427DRAFT_42414 [Gonapodya prolifera JEL478]|uniref:Uncharacterized protein n=1 Tax=Gonapodya prolifera (strain JEL478) TaxID=1344416 RepID=A0A139APU4_GONPJ|nr:hypothetical protein M427DRAFT_42414 [Gonapodya prolifera JEL478]|eukprot:KXS18777.1 hypothetical protein M427DRAFT_42414 [Gonapodya prolifera JEL478]
MCPIQLLVHIYTHNPAAPSLFANGIADQATRTADDPAGVIIALGFALWCGGGHDTGTASAEDMSVGVLADMAIALDAARRLALVRHLHKKHMTAQIDSIWRWTDTLYGYSVDTVWVIVDDVTRESAKLMLSSEEYWTRVMKVALNTSAECFGDLVVTFEKPAPMSIESGCWAALGFYKTW